MGSQWRVGSYFINVGLGDGAIHLLLDESKPLKSRVVSAVLIDGGLRGDKQIETTTGQIMKKYGLKNDDFWFRAVVVTHWDADHYGAAMDMFRNELKANKSLRWIKDNTVFYLPSTCFDDPGKSYKLNKDRNRLIIDSKEVCRAVYGHACIGIDLFSGTFLGKGQDSNNTLGLDDILGKSKEKILLQQPLLLCVGVDYKLMSGHDLDVGTATTTNGSSMMCLLVKMKDKAVEAQLYTGGDAEDFQEETLCKWLNQSHIGKLNVIKCGHHGSANATHADFFDLNPEYFIMSVGEDYGHPSLALVFFIIVYYGYRQAFADHHRILSTRYPYWLMLNSISDKPIKTTDLNVEKILSVDQVEFRKALLDLQPKIGQQPQGPPVDKYFPGCGDELGEIVGYLDDDEQKQYDYWFRKIHEFRSITVNQMSADDRKLWKKLERLSNEKWEALSRLQNDVIARMRAYWHGFALPSLPVCTTGSHRSQEVDYIYVKFFDTSPPMPGGSVPQVVMYQANAQPQINTKYYQSFKMPVKKKKKKAANKKKGADKDDGININKFMIQHKKLEDLNGKRGWLDELERDEKWKLMRTEKLVQSTTSKMVRMTLLSPSGAEAVEVDKVDELLWDFVVQDVPLSGIPSGSCKRFEVMEGVAGGLLWLKECLQATAAEITVRPESTTATPRDIDRLVIHTAKLRLDSSLAVLKRQFGDSIVDQVNFRGYHYDLEAILLGLDVTSVISLTLSEFCGTIGFRSDKMVRWVSDLLGSLPVEIQPPAHPGDDGQHKSPPPSRSGAWIQPQLDGQAILRIEGIIPAHHGSAKPFIDFIKDNLHATEVFDICVVGSVVSMLGRGPTGIVEAMGLEDRAVIHQQSQLSFAGTLQWSKANACVGFAVTVSDSGISLFLQPPATLTVKDIGEWIIDRFKSSIDEDDRQEATDTEGGIMKALGDVAKAIIPRQLSLTIGAGPSLVAFQIDVELQLRLRKEKEEHVPIHGQVRWQPGRLELLGEIWDLEDQSVVPFNINPFKETFSEVRPLEVPGEKAVDSIWLPHLFNKDATEQDFPSGIPLTLRNASVRVGLGHSKSFVIKGKLQCGAPSTDHDTMPAIWLDELQVLYMRDFGAASNVFELRGNINLKAPDYVMSVKTSAMVRVYIEYDQGWTLSAEAVNLQLANLYPLLPIDGSNHAVMHLMASVWVPDLSVSLKYSAKRVSDIKINGTLAVGPLQMHLTYRHGSTGWHLNASFKGVRPGKEDATLEELLGSFIFEHLDTLPDFVRNFKIPLAEVSADLTCSAQKTPTPTKSGSKNVVFSFTVTVDKFSFVFAQIQNQHGAFPIQNEKHKTSPKRILRFSLTGLPEAKKIPLVEQLPQPFDEMDFVWVSADVTVAEATLLNQEVFTGKTPPLHWKTEMKKGGQGDESVTVALAKGCHFQLILREQDRPSCALDYVFFGESNQKNKSAGSSPQAGPSNETHPQTTPAHTKDHPTSPHANGAITTPVTRSSKGLNIRHMGLKMKGKKTLTITIDAVASLGPVALSLLGFEVDIDFENFKKPSDIAKLGIGFSLHGMAVAFSRPPALLAGMFSREVHGNVTTYAGGLAVGVGVWQFLAAGVYEEHEDFKTIFVFAKLNGPLISFGFADINGIVGGFGYNSSLRFPSISEVTRFPFVSLNSGGEDPAGNVMDQFAALTSTKGDTAWFKSQKDSIWLAAGLGVKAFQMLEVQAVVCIDLSPNPKVGIFAEAIATLPKGSSPDKSFLFLDIGIAAVFDPSVGILSLRGELTPQSFILSKSCRLNGSFALIYFLPASGHDGDWVFSAGGYHPAFKVPSHYPRDLKRLGISWSYDSEISITGEAYFAITPQAVMGGGRLDLLFQSGHTRASFSAYADFLIYYEPFQFQATVGVNVFASARIGWGFLSKDVSAEISAEVDLHGPPVAGTAHLHFWFFTITVRFGPDHSERDPLDWAQFYTLVKQCQNIKDARDLPEHLVSLLQGRCTNGAKQDIAPPPKKGEKLPPPDPWVVRAAAFQFEIMARFPLREVRYNGKGPEESVRSRARDIFALPMKRTNKFSKSDMVITVQQEKQGTNVDFVIEPILKRVPGALWNQYDANKSLLDSDSMIEHVMGVRLTPSKSRNSPENLPPINMTEFNSLRIGGEDVRFPKAEYTCRMPTGPVTQEDKLDPNWRENQRLVCEMWEQLRHETTGGGSLYKTV